MILIFDTRTRWNNLVNVFERFLELKKCIEKVMIDLGEYYCTTLDEYSFLVGYCSFTMKLAIEALIVRDIMLFTNSRWYFNFIFVTQLDGIDVKCIIFWDLNLITKVKSTCLSIKILVYIANIRTDIVPTKLINT